MTLLPGPAGQRKSIANEICNGIALQRTDLYDDPSNPQHAAVKAAGTTCNSLVDQIIAWQMEEAAV